jgi:hypothetical protein
MEKQAKCEWLVEFYIKAAEGGVIQFGSSSAGWRDCNNTGPSIGSFNLDSWRIKPEVKVIDLSPMLELGLDCEFWAVSLPTKKGRGKLKRIRASLEAIVFYDENDWCWSGCRPRMSTEENPYIHFWKGGDKCPVPEGFDVRLHYRGGHQLDLEDRDLGEFRWLHKDVTHDIIGIEFIAVKDGYTLAAQ